MKTPGFAARRAEAQPRRDHELASRWMHDGKISLGGWGAAHIWLRGEKPLAPNTNHNGAANVCCCGGATVTKLAEWQPGCGGAMFRVEDRDISLIYFAQISDAATENLGEISSVQGRCPRFMGTT
jgi:hypothetical protein